MKVVVLGGGLVGRPMALDLAQDEDIEVTVVDSRADPLAGFPSGQAGIRTVQADLASPETVRSLVADCDQVVSAVPGHLGFRTLEAVIAAGRNVVDIAFSPEDPFELDGLAKEHGVTAVVDCGVAPGMSNVLVADGARRLDRTDRVRIWVGGLPIERAWPWEYRAPFSPIDVIEEYTRPARFVENGQLVVRPALSDVERLDFPGIGTLEAFNTDGLRTLARTIDAPDLREKTLRYPGYVEKVLLLRETGFFDTAPVEIDGKQVRPIDLTTRLLFPKWKLEPGVADLTIMRVDVEGEQGGRPVRLTWDLLDRYDAATGVHSMARTTGYTATVMVRLLAAGMYTAPGIAPPEFVGRDERCVRFLLDGLRARGVVFTETVEWGEPVSR